MSLPQPILDPFRLDEPTAFVLPMLLPRAYAIIPVTLKTRSILLESRKKCDLVTTLVNGNTR